MQDVEFDAQSMSDSGDEEERKDEVGQLPLIGLTSRDLALVNNVDQPSPNFGQGLVTPKDDAMQIVSPAFG